MMVPPDQTLETTKAAATELIAAIARVNGLKPLRRAGGDGEVGYWRVRESADIVETRGDAGGSDRSRAELCVVQTERGRGDGERDLGPDAQRRPQDVLVRSVRAAPARAEPVDRHPDGGGEVRGVAGAAAPGG